MSMSAETQQTETADFVEGVFQLLERRIGLDRETLGARALQSAISEHLRELGIPWAQGFDYLNRLQREPELFQGLVEKTVVNETWFRRDAKPFDFLTNHARQHWRGQHSAQRLRLLSIPCATGEEPYSIAISLMEAGLQPESFRIDAIDISQVALRKASEALYNSNSFRHGNPLWRDTYFRQVGEDLWRLGDGVRRCVQFQQANLLDFWLTQPAGSYQVIFSRNLLIYLSHEAKLQAITCFRHLLRPGGLLFVGHAEMLPMLRERFQPVAETATFAYTMEPPNPRGSLNLPELPERSPRVDRSQSQKLHVNTRLRSLAGKPPRAIVKQSGNLEEAAAPPPAIRPMPRVRQPQQQAPAQPAEPPPQPPAPSAEPAAEEHPGADQLFARAQKLADNGEYTQALYLAIDALNEDATHVPARHLCAVLQQVLGDLSGAETEFRRCLYLDPLHEASMTQLALLLRQTGRDQEAAQLQRRLERRSRSGRILPPATD